MQSITETAGVKFYTGTELETWRAETLLTKEPETIAWLKHQAQMGGVFYDIGANIGMFSLYASSINESLKVYAFEPINNNYYTLLKNKELNKALNLNPFQIALSNKSGLSKIFLKDDRVGNSGAQLDTPTDEYGHNFEPVDVQEVLTFEIDSLIKTFEFQLPSFIKIDVDGKEKEILEGMAPILRSETLRSLLVEFNSREEQDELSNYLKDAGFSPDSVFNDHPEHSAKRRKLKNSAARNMIFSRES